MKKIVLMMIILSANTYANDVIRIRIRGVEAPVVENCNKLIYEVSDRFYHFVAALPGYPFIPVNFRGGFWQTPGAGSPGMPGVSSGCVASIFVNDNDEAREMVDLELVLGQKRKKKKDASFIENCEKDLENMRSVKDKIFPVAIYWRDLGFQVPMA